MSQFEKVGRNRLSQVFGYLHSLNQLRNPAPRQISEQPWVLWLDTVPVCSSVSRSWGVEAKFDEAGGAVLRVERPQTTAAPEPDAILSDWLTPGWEKPDGIVTVRTERHHRGQDGEEALERFIDNPARERSLSAFQKRWDAWSVSESPIREALRLFERLYTLFAQLEREGDKLELVLADGLLNWRRPEGGIHHPVLVSRLALEFDPTVPAFSLRELERPVELYTAPFAGLPDVEGRTLAHWNGALDVELHHPLGGEDTTSLFKTLVTLLAPQGEVVETQALERDTDYPRIARRPVVFARSRGLGFTVALEAVLEGLEAETDIPPALLRIVGAAEEADAALGAGKSTMSEVLFSKPANPEQYRIAEQLDRHGAVLVQGPPGTGKSYTIGNLIGHLLAQGKTVLVTSHTTKALAVVREHVVPELRPLCVSVLDRDADSREQLEASVAGIVERLASPTGDWDPMAPVQLKRHAALKERLAKNRAQRLETLQSETRAITFAGEAIMPLAAAREVAEGAERHAWLPGPLLSGQPCPLTEGEVLSLYATNLSVTPEVERALDTRLPNPSELPEPPTFGRAAEELRRLQQVPAEGGEYWAVQPFPDEEDGLLAFQALLEGALAPFAEVDDWEVAILAAGLAGGVYRQPWDELCSLVAEAKERIGKCQVEVLAHGPRLDPGVERNEALVLLQEMRVAVGSGRKLDTMMLLFKPSWKRLLAAAAVDAGRPTSPDHFSALIALVQRDQEREALLARWHRQLTSVGGPEGSTLGAEPELAAGQLVPRLQVLLEWHSKSWLPVMEAMSRCGFQWGMWLERRPAETGSSGPAKRLLLAAQGIRPVLEARLKQVRLAALGRQFEAWSGVLSLAESGNPIVNKLRSAVDDCDPTGYGHAWEALLDLTARRAARQTREDLLARLELPAPAWASAIRNRLAPHDAVQPPGEAEKAWRFRQLHEELERRHALSIDQLQMEAEGLSREFHEATVSLIDKRAWAHQKARTTLAQQQALMGWLQVMRRIGRGTGLRVPQLQAEARRLMTECQGAIPVWIMPLARVVENFDPRTSRFDVVIVDEASQSDVMALLALYLGRQVVVVGDDQQVSPVAPGQKISDVTQLIDTHLRGIPNAVLYDGRLSIYDLALSSFGGSICLLEHFRCVPEIIEFSNQLSYDGRLKALREASSARVSPAVIPHMVAGGSVERKVNFVEALEVASLIAAAFEQPEYGGPRPATFGVISLVGDEQALEVEKLLRRHVPPVELERRRLMCGNPGQFQGDERDVVFLSLVDAPSTGPLALRQADDYKKRFNVAASRARDQLWVVHSVDPQNDLKPGDLRRRLIEHARDPMAIASAAAKAEREADSPFEQEVIRRLVAAGFRVVAQHPVGHYRIDIVVEGGGKRLAVECDGERFHPPEALEADLARQAILERSGWRFVRIRGSAFYRDPEQAMRPLFNRLEQLGIPPEGADSPAPEPPNQSELVRRLVQRAAQLRLQWAEEEEDARGVTTPLT